MAAPIRTQATLYSFRCDGVCAPAYASQLSVEIAASPNAGYDTLIRFQYSGFSMSGPAGIVGIFFQDDADLMNLTTASILPPFVPRALPFPGPSSFEHALYSEESEARGLVDVLLAGTTPQALRNALHEGLLRIGVSMLTCSEPGGSVGLACRGTEAGYISEVPEPGHLAVLALGFGGLLYTARRGQRNRRSSAG